MDKAMVRTLAAGKLDVIGDIHGELQALEALIRELGYDADGTHPDDRHLIFVGDLCDRGPDSIGVIARVKAWVDAGRAQCVLGNHELNLLLDRHREGNGWFFGLDAHREDRESGKFANCRAATVDDRAGILSFLRSLPLVLERDDLRVVHACPEADALRAARASVDTDVVAFHEAAEQALRQQAAASPDHARIEAERMRYDKVKADPQARVSSLPHLAASEATQQNGHPVRVLTSGREVPGNLPFYSTGKWRLLDRDRWWNRYDDEVAVIFGHYWRTPTGMTPPEHKGAPDLFAEHPDDAWLGLRGNAFCVDHCVGVRFVERMKGRTEKFEGRLSAMRWPERELVMDDGRRASSLQGSGFPKRTGNHEAERRDAP